MADIFRIVTFSTGGRPITQVDLETGTTYFKVRDTFKVTPGPRRTQLARIDARYGGSNPLSEGHDNGEIAATWAVSGTTAAQAIANIRALLREAEQGSPSRYIEWRPEGASQSVFFQRRGAATWTPNYSWAQFAGANMVTVDISWPVAPVAIGAPMDILDDFSVNSLVDYTFDAGAGTTSVDTVNGRLVPSTTAAKRAIHTARGYDYGDMQVTVRHTTGAGIGAGSEVGVILKRINANNYLAVRFILDTGTLQIRRVTGGTAATLGTPPAALGAVPANAVRWVRGRMENDTVYAEVFAAQPTPMGAPVASYSTTLTGTDLTQFGGSVGIVGKPGIMWTPSGTDARVDDFEVLPYTYRDHQLPDRIDLRGPVPGDIAALLETEITPSGGGAAPIWGLISWARTPTGSASLFRVVEAESASQLSGWTPVSTSATRNGMALRDTGTGVKDDSATYDVDLTQLADPDEFTAEITVEVWVRYWADPVLQGLRMSVAAGAYDVGRPSAEYGEAGKLLVASFWRMARLGTVTWQAEADRPISSWLALRATTLVASSGWLQIDYLLLVPSKARALGPTAKSYDESYPVFAPEMVETRKVIRSDLSGYIAPPWLPPPSLNVHNGLGGALPRLPVGTSSLMVALSSRIPDDPTTAAGTDMQSSHQATVHASVTPRYLLMAA